MIGHVTLPLSGARVRYWLYPGLCVCVLGCGSEAVDWTFAHLELLQKQGVDLRHEMETRSVSVSVAAEHSLF